MQILELLSIPNQEFSVLLDGFRYVIQIQELPGQIMGVTITRDDIVIASCVRAVPGYPILRYPYLVGDAGNFAFITANDEYPYFKKFNTTQQFAYASAAEINEAATNA